MYHFFWVGNTKSSIQKGASTINRRHPTQQAEGTQKGTMKSRPEDRKTLISQVPGETGTIDSRLREGYSLKEPYVEFKHGIFVMFPLLCRIIRTGRRNVVVGGAGPFV
eukprot:Protomagalhaensia_sp_Gyna_25__5110@NODE_58_length_5893_cov_92_436112_g43_i0_p8_GENE_NODE_58_length_5893_cov_92_436112_g43_i0NODE_58_length_5893_cov_92_436112_g43_i0_p8_ORF_typecomplete_len108_score8_91Ilar_coat/PF01787_16/0_11_NODE_58_length_5893_cov_92_436112_g43_i050765399